MILGSCPIVGFSVAAAVLAAAVAGVLHIALKSRKPLVGKTQNTKGYNSVHSRPCGILEGFRKLKLSAADQAVFPNCGTTGTITFFQGDLGDAQTHLKVRCFPRLAKNSWLSGRLSSDMGHAVIVHPSTLSEEHMHELLIDDTDPGNLSPKMPIADLCRKVLAVHNSLRVLHLRSFIERLVVVVVTVAGGYHHIKVWPACAVGRIPECLSCDGMHVQAAKYDLPYGQAAVDNPSAPLVRVALVACNSPDGTPVDTSADAADLAVVFHLSLIAGLPSAVRFMHCIWCYMHSVCLLWWVAAP
jgi:hypothetical protein